MTRRSPKSQMPAESACSAANYQSPCVTSAPGNDRLRHDQSWNEYSFHDFAGHVVRLSRSKRVRRQGLEPRTRGLRVAWPRAPNALPARMPQTGAAMALIPPASTSKSVHEPVHDSLRRPSDANYVPLPYGRR
jgi:hypothetical protein